MPRQPIRVTTTHIWWPPSEVHYATHERQPVCNPLSKTQTPTPKTATQGLPKGWRSPDWVDMVTVTHVNRVTPNIYRPVPKPQSRRQSDRGLQSEWQWTQTLPSPQRRVDLDTIPSSEDTCSQLECGLHISRLVFKSRVRIKMKDVPKILTSFHEKKYLHKFVFSLDIFSTHCKHDGIFMIKITFTKYQSTIYILVW